MKRKSAEDRPVRLTAAEIPPATAGDLRRLRAAMKRPIDTSGIPEQAPGASGARRIVRGRRPAPPRSAIRDAILEQLGRRQMTRYQLWKRAHACCPTLPESAVYEFLRGERQVGLAYIEALLAALGLAVRRTRPDRRTARAG